MTLNIAILDDYQNVALKLADWKKLGPEVAITVFSDHFGNEDSAATALAGFDILCLSDCDASIIQWPPCTHRHNIRPVRIGSQHVSSASSVHFLDRGEEVARAILVHDWSSNEEIERVKGIEPQPDRLPGRPARNRGFVRLTGKWSG